MTNTPLPSKPHYQVLDGLRGVASMMVVLMHVCEAHATSHLDMFINHGYLAVDFFFVLSGFVIGYAYDDRWGRMRTGGFFRRRLIRLHPMVVAGMIVGALLFYSQAGTLWPMISETPFWKMLLVTVIGLTLVPIPSSMDIRGWHEMHPLNGPAWSLFFEYAANILYAFVLRKLPDLVLGILTAIAALALIQLAVTSQSGDLIGGWSLDAPQLRIGITRLLYPFLAGLLLSRIIRLKKIPSAFTWCSLLTVLVLAMPRIGGADTLWMNGWYDALSVILLFPLIVFLGAGGEIKGKTATAVCRFLGDLSYPLYITHYPLVYLYTAWVAEHRTETGMAVVWGIAVVSAAILLAYACLRWYDIPVRKWLSKTVRQD
ncbi:acyltransferase family protein [Sediminibacterium soli]|uniref:acyltransferase family protein n=1 Tax=Sediminibacterium soli TaxID=2698829 RepID=UPI0013794A3B|nr:acyltransferase [Sediminibacterium soli]NCI45184.1 acyltransferase [Sediminibacterium soli]